MFVGVLTTFYMQLSVDIELVDTVEPRSTR